MRNLLNSMLQCELDANLYRAHVRVIGNHGFDALAKSRTLPYIVANEMRELKKDSSEIKQQLLLSTRIIVVSVGAFFRPSAEI